VSCWGGFVLAGLGGRVIPALGVTR
jgi:hypothetical protein